MHKGEEMNLYDTRRRYFEYKTGALPKGFHYFLFEAIRRADEDNLDRLREGFPNEVQAYEDDKKGIFTLEDMTIEHARGNVRYYKMEDESWIK